MTGPRWMKRVLFVATVLVAWVVATPAFAHAREFYTSVSAAGQARFSSASTPPMSLRVDETAPTRSATRAPLCDLRCATTFAPVPQFQDEEVSLALTEDGSGLGGAQLDAARMVPSGPHDDPSNAHADPCTVAPDRVSAAPPAAILAPAGAGVSHGPDGVTQGLERPPR